MVLSGVRRTDGSRGKVGEVRKISFPYEDDIVMAIIPVVKKTFQRVHLIVVSSAETKIQCQYSCLMVRPQIFALYNVELLVRPA